MKNIIIILFLFFFINCSNKKDSINNNIEIVKKSIQIIINSQDHNRVSSCYIVNPYLDNLSLKDYSHKNRSFILQKLKLDEIKFEEFADSINKNYNKVTFHELSNLSNCKKSYNVITFSSFNDELILVKIGSTYQEIGLDSLDSNYKIHYNQAKLYAFFLNSDGGIIDKIEQLIFYN